MRRIVQWIAIIVIFFLGWGWRILDVIGRGDVFVKLPDFVGQFQQFLIHHQEIGYQIAPWVLMAVPTLFLVWLQWPDFWHKGGVQAIPNFKAPADSEFISLNEAANIAYEQLRQRDSIYATAAEKLGYKANGESRADATLGWFAYLLMPKLEIFGKHPPSRLIESIDRDEFKRGGLQKGGAEFYYHHEKEPSYIDLQVRRPDVEHLIRHLIDGEQQAFEGSAAQAEYDRAFHNAALLSGSRDDAKLLLAELRGEGTKIRNVPFTVASMVDAELETWIASVAEWCADAIEAIKYFDPAQAEWLATLNEVQSSNVGIPNIQLGGKTQRERYISNFLQHNDRLGRFEKLCLTFGVGVDYRH